MHIYRLTYEERAPMAKNILGKQLFELMARKRTNLSVAADVGSAEEMLKLADAVGPYIAVLKTHVDVFDSWTEGNSKELLQLAEKHGAFYKISSLLDYYYYCYIAL